MLLATECTPEMGSVLESRSWLYKGKQVDEYKSESRMRNVSRREVQYYFICYLVIILASHILMTSKGIGTRVVAAMNLLFFKAHTFHCGMFGTRLLTIV